MACGPQMAVVKEKSVLGKGFKEISIDFQTRFQDEAVTTPTRLYRAVDIQVLKFSNYGVYKTIYNVRPRKQYTYASYIESKMQYLG